VFDGEIYINIVLSEHHGINIIKIIMVMLCNASSADYLGKV